MTDTDTVPLTLRREDLERIRERFAAIDDDECPYCDAEALWGGGGIGRTSADYYEHLDGCALLRIIEAAREALER